MSDELLVRKFLDVDIALNNIDTIMFMSKDVMKLVI